MIRDLHVQDAGTATEAADILPTVPELPVTCKTSERLGSLQTQGSKFWMVSLPSLPGEGALTADPYSRVGASLERKESAPPAKPPCDTKA